jgi:hypothetical protein
LVGSAAPLAEWSTGAESFGELPAQTRMPAVVDRLVDRLVAHMPRRPVRVGEPQPGGDLLGAPLQLELVLDDLAQVVVDREAASTVPAGPFPSTGMGEVTVVHAPIVGAEVAAQLPAHRRRRPAQPPGDLPHADPAVSESRDPLALQLREVAARAVCLAQSQRR